MAKLTRDQIDTNYRAKLGLPLQFGNPEQIRLLRQWVNAIDELEEEDKARKDPTAPLVRWRVEYSYRVDDSEYVEARTREEAEDLVTDLHDDEEDFDILDVRMVDPARKRALA